MYYETHQCIAMAEWDNVETEFPGDETTNFGPREESGTALYQVDTLATISTHNKEPGEVSTLITATVGELACVGVNQHLSVFKDSQHQITVAFDNVVEDVAMSPDGSLLVAVDSGGQIFIFNADSLESIFSQTIIPSKGRAFQKILFSADTVGLCDLLLLTACGVLVVIKDLDTRSLVQECDNITKVVLQKLQFTSVQTEAVHTKKSYDIVPLGQGNVITVGSGDNIIGVWKWQNGGPVLVDSMSRIFDKDLGIVSAKLASNNRMLFALDESSEISLWCFPNLIMLTQITSPQSNMLISDFLLLETEGSKMNSLEGMRIVIQEQHVDEDLRSGSTLRILDVSSRDFIYTLQLGNPTHLPKCTSNQESLYVAEGTPAIGNSNKVSTIRFRCLTETDPETRLHRILHKKKFDEAFEFAKLFELNTELVYAAQMNHLLDLLSPWNVKCFDEQTITTMIKQLWACMNSVQDCILVAENCMRSALPSFVDTWKLLLLCQNKLETIKVDKIEKVQALQSKILDIQNRLMTYKLIFGAENYSAENWILFLQANLLHLACRKMADNSPHLAILLWRRHAGEWTGLLTAAVVGHLLMALPEYLTGSLLLGWLLDDFMPFIVHFLPNLLSQVVQWTIQRAINMEQKEKEDWPQSAINFLDAINRKVSQLIEVDCSGSLYTAAENAAKTRIEIFSVLEPLREVLVTLQNLDDLQKYNLQLSLSQFQQETKETLAFRMLDRVLMVEFILPTLEKYIAPYMRANQLDQDHIFATYVRDLLERTGHNRAYTGRSTWEEKVLAIISYINDPKEKCLAVLNVMKHAPLPWSSEIQQLVENGLKISHPLVSELREQKKIATVHQLIQDYGLKINGIPSKGKAQKFAGLIIDKDRETSLEDAMKVLTEYSIRNEKTELEVYFHYSRVLIFNEQIFRYMALIRSLPTCMAKKCGLSVISLAELMLEHCPPSSCKETEEKYQRLLTEATVLTLRHLVTLMNDKVELDQLNGQLGTFCGLASLQREYNIFFSVRDYCDEEHCGVIFAKYVQECLKSGKPCQKENDFAAVYRLAELLNLKQMDVRAELAINGALAGNIDAAVHLCRELLCTQPTPKLGQVLYQVGMALLRLQPGENNACRHDIHRILPNLVQQLASHALIMCDAVLLPQCLDLSKAANLWKRANEQCEVYDVLEVFQSLAPESKPSSKRPLQSYTLDVVYIDEALVMNSMVALPLVHKCLASSMALVEDDEDEDQSENSTLVEASLFSLQPALMHLKENSHLELGLRFVIHTFSIIHQMLLRCDMGYPISLEIQDWLKGQKEILTVAEKKAVDIKKELVSHLIQKVFSAKHVDRKMALAYLLTLPRKAGIECLKKSIASCGLNFHKLRDVASVGLALGQLMKETSLVATCQDIEIGAKWGVCLAKLKISFKEAFQGGVSAKHEVIAALANCEQVNNSIIADFCSDFKLELEDGYIVYLEHLLKRSQTTGFTENPAGNSMHAARLARAQETVTNILALECQNSLLSKLNILYKQTSPYDYENIEFLLEEINKLEPRPIHSKGLKLVNYLKVYTRRNPPSEYELSCVMKDHKEERMASFTEHVPQGASHRIPLHLLLDKDAWKIISSELESETVPIWLQIAPLLNFSTDEIYIVAVQNMVHQHVAYFRSSNTSATGRKPGASAAFRGKKTQTIPNNWSCSESSLKFLEKVQQLLYSVSNCDMALACANWIVKELPMGGEKVIALQGSVAFAKHWHSTCEDNTPQKEKSKAAYLKFEKVLCKILTEQVLYKHNLAEPTYLQLVSTPLDLISQLTEHPTIVSDCQQNLSNTDVYAAVEEIANMNNLSLGAALISSLQKWLLCTDMHQDADTTLNISFSSLKFTEEADISEQNNMKRALYFLRRGPKQEYLEFLIDTSVVNGSENISHIGQMQCLYCLLQIANNEDLRPFNHTTDSIRELLRVLCYLSQLEQLHIQHSVQTFIDCNKLGLIKGIWRNHSHQKHAVLLVASLCIDYSIHDRQQWAAILQQMLNLHMLENLEHVLQRLSFVTIVWSIPVFVRAWQTLLMAPLTKATIPLTEDQTRICLHSFNLIHSCPVSGRLDLQALSKHFHHLGLDVCAAACLDMDPLAQETDVQKIVGGDRSKLLSTLYDLTRMGLNIATVTQVRERIFLQILQEGDYQSVIPAAVNEFISFIILQNDIDGCLAFAMSNKMFSQAESVLDLYFQAYPSQQELLNAWCEENGCTVNSHLEAYLQMKNLL